MLLLAHKMNGFTYEIYTNFMDDFLNCLEVVVFKLDSDGNVTEKIAVIPPVPSSSKLNSSFLFCKYLPKLTYF